MIHHRHEMVAIPRQGSRVGRPFITHMLWILTCTYAFVLDISLAVAIVSRGEILFFAGAAATSRTCSARVKLLISRYHFTLMDLISAYQRSCSSRKPPAPAVHLQPKSHDRLLASSTNEIFSLYRFCEDVIICCWFGCDQYACA